MGFTLALVTLGSVRELFGAGEIFGQALFGATYSPVLLVLLPPGGFIVLGLLLAAINRYTQHRA